MRTRVTVLTALTVGLSAVLYAAVAPSEEFDLPNEKNAIKKILSKEQTVRSIARIITFKPDVLCISSSGIDPRVVYTNNISSGLHFDLSKPRSYYEGKTIFLFANQDVYYIEKFDHTYISFDELHHDECRSISDSFSITIGAPTNKYRYSRYSAKIVF